MFYAVDFKIGELFLEVNTRAVWRVEAIADSKYFVNIKTGKVITKLNKAYTKKINHLKEIEYDTNEEANPGKKRG